MPRRTKIDDETTVRVEKRGNAALLGAVLTLGIFITVGVIMWGQSDTGQIDVSATISNSGNNTDANGVAITPPSETFQNMPNGGLVPQSGDSMSVPTPEPEQASTTVDGTVASTTEDGTETIDDTNTQESVNDEAATSEVGEETVSIE